MPTASGKLQLQDYTAALSVRGFDSFQPSELTQMVNFGYRDVGRSFPWLWTSTSGSYVINPGSFKIDISSASPLTPDSIENIVIATDPYRGKLEPMEYHRFQEAWLALDLTSAANQGSTDQYIVYQNAIYLLPPPRVTLTFIVYFKQFLADLVAVTDVPALPQAFDEIILDAALVRAHRRAHELTLAAEAQQRVDNGIMDMLANDVWVMEEQQERVLPDDQWY